MPFADYADFDACVAANQDVDDPDAYCAAIKRKVEGADALSDREAKALEDTDCPEGQVSINGECVPVEEVEDVPPGALDLSTPRIMASAARLDTQPIEREELSDGEVAYRNIKLVDSGVWTDQNSKTPTLYDERTFENIDPEFDTRQYDGPPVNIAHDIHKDGPKAGEPHQASIGGYIDPDSIGTDGEALFGDIILNTDDPAGAFADENLKSALENDGTAGFSPSVEIMPTELEDADHPHAEEHVAAGELTGTGLVRDPASKSVDLRHETQSRAVALAAADGRTDKARVYERERMSDEPDVHDQIRAEILSRELQAEDIQDDAQSIADELEIPVDEVMEVLDPLLDMGGDGDGEGDGEGQEMGDGEGEEEEEEEQEMADGEAIDVLEEQIDDLWDAIDELKDEMATGEEMSAELEDAKAELADADTVSDLREAKEELDKRLSTIEEQEKERKTLADGDDADAADFEPTYDDPLATKSGW